MVHKRMDCGSKIKPAAMRGALHGTRASRACGHESGRLLGQNDPRSLSLDNLMASETWLRPNRRALAFGMLVPAALLVCGLLLVSAARSGIALEALGGLLALVGFMGLVGLAAEMRRARLAYCDGHLLVNMRFGRPVAVPIQFVEGFFLGRGPSLLPGRNRRAETSTLVVRLADRAPDWAFQPTKPALGTWCGGYITLRGTWCEPLNVSLASRLNRRLAEVNQALTGTPEPAR